MCRLLRVHHQTYIITNTTITYSTTCLINPKTFLVVSQVLFVGDSYVPVTTQLRSRPISPADSTVLDWRLQTVESWDGRRHGNNKTRVQRTYIIFLLINITYNVCLYTLKKSRCLVLSSQQYAHLRNGLAASLVGFRFNSDRRTY